MAGHLTIPEGWVPDFEGQRPPFAPGNTLSLKHGVDSSRRVDPIANRFIEELRLSEDQHMQYLAQPRFTAAVWAWAQAEAKVQLVSDWVDGMEISEAAESGRGQTSALELLRKWQATAQTQRARLGLDPLSAARLGKDVAQGNQADAAGELTRLRAQHEAATRKTPPPPLA